MECNSPVRLDQYLVADFNTAFAMWVAYRCTEEKHVQEEEGLKKSAEVYTRASCGVQMRFRTGLTTAAELAAFVPNERRTAIIIMQIPRAPDPHIIGFLLPILSAKNVG